jgi:FixJ family two-component response regulator
MDILTSWTYECPVILITGVQNPDLKGREKALGIIDIIRKPFDPLELMTYFKSIKHL